MHEDIVKFTREGEMRDDSEFIRIKDLFRRDIEDEMRQEGFVPVLDLQVHWSTEYVPDKKRYKFKISVYGVHIGGDDLSRITGITDGKVIRAQAQT